MCEGEDKCYKKSVVMKIAMYVISDTGGATHSIAFHLYFYQPLHIHSEYILKN